MAKTLYAIVQGERITKTAGSHQLRVFTTERAATDNLAMLVMADPGHYHYRNYSVATINADFTIKRVVTTEVPLEVF